MASKPKPDQELSRSTKIHQLEERFYTTTELSALLGRSYRSIQNYIAQGKIHTDRGPGGQHRIPRDEVMRLLGVTDDKTYFGYFKSHFPHQNFLIYLMIDTQFDFESMRRQCQAFRLPIPDNNILYSLKQSIIKSAPRNIRNKLITEHPVYKCHNLKQWLDTLGLSELYRDVSYPCINILHDHSDSRLHLETLLSAQVNIEDIVSYIRDKFKLHYSEDQVLFFQTYFYNLREMTYMDYCTYMKYIKDPAEKNLKSKCWGSPQQAKILLAIPDRADFDKYFNVGGEIAFQMMQEKNAAGTLEVPELKSLVDTMRISSEQDMKRQKVREEEIANAMQNAEKSSENTIIEVVNEERVVFEDLDQVEKPESESPAVKAG